MKNIYSILLVACAIVLSSCAKDDRPEGTLSFDGTVQGLFTEGRINDVDLFYDAVVRAGLESEIAGATERTYFVPNNAAMKTALESGGFISVSQADVAFLTALINNHTVNGILVADALTKSDLTTLGGETIYVSNNGSIILNGQATVSDGNNQAGNGIVHVIDFPILSYPSGTIASIVSGLADADSLFTILRAALVATGLDQTLAASDPNTVFAPTDDAFIAAGFADFAALDAATTDDELTDILLYHVIAGRNLTVDLSSGRTFTLLGPSGMAQGIDIEASSSAVALDIAIETTSDTEVINIMATNGVIHIIDDVLTAEPYLSSAFDGTQGYAGANDVLVGTFYTSLIGSTVNVDSLLGSEAEHTVVAVRSYVAPGTADSLEADLLGHIFAGSIDVSAEVGNVIESVNGRRYYVTANDTREYINGKGITIFTSGASLVEDGEAYNGLWHMFNSGNLVPLPETSTTTQVEGSFGMATDTLSLFSAALRFLELDSISGSTYLFVENTMLADTYRDAIDAASADNDIDITGIGSTDYDSLISLLDVLDASILSTVINRHIIDEVVFAVNFEAGNTYTDRNGNTIEIVEVMAGGEDSFGILVNDDGSVFTIAFDEFDATTGSNGIVHTLSAIIPQ